MLLSIDGKNLLSGKPIHGYLEVLALYGSEQNVKGIKKLVPDSGFRTIHTLLHVATGFQIGSSVMGYLQIQHEKFMSKEPITMEEHGKQS